MNIYQAEAYMQNQGYRIVQEGVDSEGNPLWSFYRESDGEWDDDQKMWIPFEGREPTDKGMTEDQVLNVATMDANASLGTFWNPERHGNAPITATGEIDIPMAKFTIDQVGPDTSDLPVWPNTPEGRAEAEQYIADEMSWTGDEWTLGYDPATGLVSPERVEEAEPEWDGYTGATAEEDAIAAAKRNTESDARQGLNREWVAVPDETRQDTYLAVPKDSLDLPEEEEEVSGTSRSRARADAEFRMLTEGGNWEEYRLPDGSYGVREKEGFDTVEEALADNARRGGNLVPVWDRSTQSYILDEAPEEPEATSVQGRIDQFILDGRIDEAFKLNEIRNRLNTKKISREEAARMVANVAQTPQEFDTWISALVDEDRWLTDTPEVIRRAEAAVPSPAPEPELVQFQNGMAVPRDGAGIVQPPTDLGPQPLPELDSEGGIIGDDFVRRVKPLEVVNATAATVEPPRNLGNLQSVDHSQDIRPDELYPIEPRKEVAVETPNGELIKVRSAQNGGKVLNAGLVYVDPGEDIIPAGSASRFVTAGHAERLQQQALQRDPSRYTGEKDIGEHRAMSGFRQIRDARARGVVPIPGSQIMGGGATFAGSPYRTYSSTADRLAALPASWSRSKRAQFDVGQAQQIQARQQAFRQRRPGVRLFR